MIEEINIIGLGVVGSALYNVLKTDLSIKIFDKSTALFNKQLITDESIVFICVDTPMLEAGCQDSSNITNILEELVRQDYRGLIVIKSTVLYSNISDYENKLNIVLNPEFLNQATANSDFKTQRYQVIGGNIQLSKRLANFYETHCEFAFRPEGFIFEFCSTKEAIDFKYMRNIKLAMNVIYWDMVYDLTGDSNKIYNMMSKIPTPENHIVGHNGYRGYGQSSDKTRQNFSACLDKDLKAKLCESNNSFLRYINQYNYNLLLKQ